jgi:hypothetical protein
MADMVSGQKKWSIGKQFAAAILLLLWEPFSPKEFRFAYNQRNSCLGSSNAQNNSK